MNEREALAEPLPCPFCGHVGLEFAEGSTFRWLAYSCCGCGIGSETRVQTMGDGEPEYWRAQAERDAIKEWNTRAVLAQPEPEPVARLLHWVGPSPRPGAECIARTFAEYPVGTDGNRAYWSEGAKLYAAPPAPAQPALSPSEAVFAFAGWLTCRDESVTMGTVHNAAIAAELVVAFCESQHLDPPRQDWSDAIKPYPAPPAPAQPADEDGMCPNCITPWKCNGPHISTGKGTARTLVIEPPPAPAQPERSVFVCPSKDIVCGDNPANWCARCPARDAFAESAQPALERALKGQP